MLHARTPERESDGKMNQVRSPHELTLELVRAEEAGDPFAFRTGRQEYLLRGAGGGFESVELTWSQTLLTDLAALHQPGCDPAVLQRVGETLRRFLEPAGWARHEATLTEAVANGQPVVVTLRFAAAELYALPWELLTLGSSGQHLGELPSVLVRYEWPETVTTAEPPSPRPEGGRILFAWSSAGGPVPHAEHLRALEESTRAGHHPFDARRDVLEHATYGRLEDALKAAKAPGGTPISVLHLLCHGGAAGQTCGLLLDGEYAGESAVVDAGRLRALLAPYANMVRLVVVSACNSGNMGALGNQLGSIAQTLHRAGLASVIASRFPFSIPGSNRFSETFYRELLGGPSSVESAFLAARRQLARDTSRLDWASLQLYAREADGEDSRPLVLRPYRGLLAFQPEHSRFFFGRDAEISETLSDLEALTKAGAPRFLVIAGASGTGKSSVVLAGAVPRLLGAPEARWEFARMRPGAEPLAALDAALATRSDPSRPLLLVVDQFEEVFTQTESAEARNAFARRLWSLAGETDSGVSVLITLRVDFIGHCGDLPLDDQGLRLDKVAYDEAHRVFVAQMTPAQLEEAITRPAGLVGLSLEAGLARRMLEEVAGEPGALPLLQDTLDLLWQRRKGRKLTQAAYDAVGGVTGALNGRADARIAGLDEADKAVARRLLVRLVSVRTDTAMDTRRRAPLEELRPRGPEEQARFERIVGQFVDERLLVRTNDGKSATVEVAHEALIRKWPQLRRWVDEDRVKLAELKKVASWVEEWKRHGALLNAEQLGFAQEVAKRSGDELGEDARKLLEESLAEAHRRRRNQRLVIAGTALAAVVFAVLGGWGQRQATEARTQATEARKQALQARDAGRVSVARQMAHIPDIAVAALREVEVKDPKQALGWLGTVPQFSSHAFLTRGTLKGHEKSVVSATFSPDGTRVVTASMDGTGRVWTADGTPLTELKGHAGAVVSATFSPDGTRILTASHDGTARLWTADGTPLTELKGHAGPIYTAAFSHDGTRILTASSDKTARVWMADGTFLAELKGHGEQLRTATFSPDGTRILTTSDDGTTRLWTAAGTPLTELKGHTGAVFSATFSPDGTRILTASMDGTTRLWRADGTPLAELKGHAQPVVSAAFSPDGTRVVTASIDNTARVWRADGTPLAELKGHGGQLRTATFSPDGTLILTASDDGTARVWTADGTFLAELKGHGDVVVSATFSPDGTRILTASWDKTARVWTTDDALSTKLKGHAGPIYTAAFSPDGTRILTTSSDKTARVWRADGTPLAELKGHAQAVLSATFSPDGTRVVTASIDNTARVWTADGTPLAELKGHAQAVLSAAFSPNGTRVVTASRDGTARVWRADGPPLAELKGHTKAVLSATFSPDGTRVVTASRDGTARVWTADGTPLAELKGHAWDVVFATFSPDGTRILTASHDKTARVWTADGTPLAELKGHAQAVLSAAFSPDGTRILTASGDGTARVWTADGTPLAELKGHAGPVESATFSHDGARILTASWDKTARVWTADGALLVKLEDYRGSAAFSPDGTRIITASDDKTARVWTIEPSAVRQRLWYSTAICLEPDERSRLFGESQPVAELGHTACQAMTECLRSNEGTRTPNGYEGCLEKFQKAQAEAYSLTQ